MAPTCSGNVPGQRSSIVIGDQRLHATWRGEATQKPHLLSRGGVPAHSGSVTDVLVVTTTVGVLHWVHGHTTHLHTAAAPVSTQPSKHSD